MAAPIQTQYGRHLQRQWPGTLARPNEPHAYDPGKLYVPTAGETPLPGYGVLYDAAQDAFKLPSTDAEELLVIGVLGFNPGEVPTVLSAPPAGANSDTQIQYKNGAIVKIGVFGTFNVIAGEAMEYGDSLEYDRTNKDWRKYAGPAVGVAPQLSATPSQANVNTALTAARALIEGLRLSFQRVPVVCVSKSVKADELVEVRVGYGRVR